MAIKDGSLEHLDISVSDLERSGEFWAAFLNDLGYREFAKSATGWSWTNDSRARQLRVVWSVFRGRRGQNAVDITGAFVSFSASWFLAS